jgi:hypothetical protein
VHRAVLECPLDARYVGSDADVLGQALPVLALTGDVGVVDETSDRGHAAGPVLSDGVELTVEN